MEAVLVEEWNLRRYAGRMFDVCMIVESFYEMRISHFTLHML